MQPILTPSEMAAVDAAAPEPVEVLINRAAAAVAREARHMLGGAYGRRVLVIAGKGNNGNDGRVAADLLRAMGMRVEILNAADAPDRLPHADLVIDAAYGTGFRGTYCAPQPHEASLVLAVDIPSGVSGLTGEACGAPMAAHRTVTFAALKPGLMLGSGRRLTGAVTVADIGLDVSRARAHLVEQVDVAAWYPKRSPESHKWRSATWVVAGSPTMLGASHLAARGAQRAGASYVRVSSPGVHADPGRPDEAVAHPLPAAGWAREVLGALGKIGSLAVGPGLGRSDSGDDEVRALVAGAALPTVVDGDGLGALGLVAADVIGARAANAPRVVLTPHEGEFAALGGNLDSGAGHGDRLAEVRSMAGRLGAVVLLKGSTTLVAHPDGRILAVTAGDERLATAGTGDVLTGIIAALLARGADPFQSAAAAAWLHGRAGALAFRDGMVAGDLPDLLPAALGELRMSH